MLRFKNPDDFFDVCLRTSDLDVRCNIGDVVAVVIVFGELPATIGKQVMGRPMSLFESSILFDIISLSTRLLSSGTLELFFSEDNFEFSKCR